MAIDEYKNTKTKSTSNPYDDQLEELLKNKDYAGALNLEKYNYRLKQGEANNLSSMSEESQMALSENKQNYQDTTNQNYVNNEIRNKYLGDNLKYQGITQGGEEAYLKANQTNAYETAQNNAYLDYLNSEKEIRQGEIDAQNEQLTSLIGAATSMDEVYSYLKNYGYVDENNNYTAKWLNMSEADKAYFSSIVTNAEARINSAATPYADLVDGKQQFNSEAVGNLGYMLKNGNYSSESISVGMSAEYKAMVRYQGNFRNGTAIKLQSGGNNAGTAYLIYIDGAYYQISEDEYNQFGGDRYSFSYGSGSGDTSSVRIEKQ